MQSWVQKNAPKLVTYAESLSKPVLTVGKGAISLLIELFTIFVLVLLLLLEAPKMRRWILGQMRPERAATVTRIGSEVSGSVTGYMLGNLLTSLIAGVVVFVTLMVVGVPFPLLWGLWVALVDFLPMIGGALAGIPTVLFAWLKPVHDAALFTALWLPLALLTPIAAAIVLEHPVNAKGREGLLFVNKKKQKNFYNAGLWALAVTTPIAQHSQKFLRRFFQKAASVFYLR